MDVDCDVVFFGDSITSGHNWQEDFPEVSVVNLSVPGDALLDMYNRLDMVASVKPEKVFIMGGVNGIRDGVTDVYLKRYALILDELETRIPGVEIYVQSVLPVSRSKEDYVCKNSTIREFDEGLEKLAEERGLVYINLYELYEVDGAMNPDLTRDGLHLNDAGYVVWINEIERLLQ